ncbi:MAG: zinc-binding dehydrogenase, partial [Phycisphaerae bacterium]|nr:zinc-binding dehydrogenase [Phycisphaerae bacterium]
WVRRGGRFPLKMPHVLGSDAAGVIAKVGPGVAGLTVGQEVVLSPGLSCGQCEFCQRGEQTLCEQFAIIGAGRPGTFAQFVAVPAANCLPKPAYLSFEQAGCLAVAYVTAWRMLMTKAGLKAGETVLIHGVGGGVALAGLQLAKLAGARVIVTSSSDDKLAKAAKLGADVGLNYRTTADLPARIRDLTGARGVDVVLETVGAATWPVSLAVLRRGGRVVICGTTSGPEATMNLQQLYWNQYTLLGSTFGSRDDFRQLLAAMAKAKMQPVVDSVVPLDQARPATERMESGQQFGKIVLTVP